MLATNDSVIAIRRQLLIPKHIWRAMETKRTLGEFEFASSARNAWEGVRPDNGPSIYEVDLVADDPLRLNLSCRALRPATYLWLFQLVVRESVIRVRLKRELASREVGAPHRPDQFLGQLEVLQPLRIIINGRLSGSSGQHYCLQDFHFIRLAGEWPERLNDVHVLDLQEDLF